MKIFRLHEQMFIVYIQVIGYNFFPTSKNTQLVFNRLYNSHQLNSALIQQTVNLNLTKCANTRRALGNNLSMVSYPSSLSLFLSLV